MKPVTVYSERMVGAVVAGSMLTIEQARDALVALHAAGWTVVRTRSWRTMTVKRKRRDARRKVVE